MTGELDVYPDGSCDAEWPFGTTSGFNFGVLSSKLGTTFRFDLDNDSFDLAFFSLIVLSIFDPFER